MNREKLREVLVELGLSIMPWVVVGPDDKLMSIRQDKFEPALAKAEAAISALVPEWVSVEKDLPPLGQWVLAYDHKYLPFQFIAQRIDPDTEGWCWVAWTPTGWFSVSPSHWMPLPEPPKEGERC